MTGWRGPAIDLPKLFGVQRFEDGVRGSRTGGASGGLVTCPDCKFKKNAVEFFLCGHCVTPSG